MTTAPAPKTHYRSCHLCEAICGLEIKTEGDKILSIRGDKNDPFSKGHICPKGTALQDLHQDPDRLRKPVKKVGKNWQEISWEEAFELVADKICSLQETYGNDSIAFFAGNPGVHNYGTMTHGGLLRRAVGTKIHYSATSLDQLPHMLASLKLYGHQFMIPIPDIDHTNYMVIMGGNPLASNGSIMTVPDVKNRLKAIQNRGGKFTVIDPRRTETAAIADRHHFIRPGTDGLLLMAILHTLFTDDLVQESHLSPLLTGIDTVKAAVAPFTPSFAAAKTGIDADTIRSLAHDLATIEGAVLYGRMGVSVQEFGGLCQWAIQLINILCGNLDVRGGAIVPTPAFANVTAQEKSPGHFAKSHSRVRGLPNFSGEFPAVTFAEEVLTEGQGQVKGLVTIATNPALSTPDADQIEQALRQLDFMVSIDFYINETTCHADVILPPSGPLEHDHYDIVFNRFAVRDITRYNAPVFDKAEGSLHDWEIMNGLSQAIAKRKNIDVAALPAPHILVDMGIQHGPYGAATGAKEALTLEKVQAHPHGLDLGPLKPGLKDRLGPAPSINLATDIMIDDLKRLETAISSLDDNEFYLIGRRHLRSNNSWMHNSKRLVKGPPRWQLLMHPADLSKNNISDGDQVTISTVAGTVTTVAKASEDMMSGVISLPHGWGHKGKNGRLATAKAQEGVNCNILTSTNHIDKLSGNAALNGIRAKVYKA